MLEIYAEFSRSGATYTPFPDPRSHRIRLADLAEELSNQASRLGLQLSQGPTGGGRLIDLSTRQNMLVQRLARLYMQAYRGDRSQGCWSTWSRRARSSTPAWANWMGHRKTPGRRAMRSPR